MKFNELKENVETQFSELREKISEQKEYFIKQTKTLERKKK